jgi:hypothetical protein
VTDISEIGFARYQATMAERSAVVAWMIRQERYSNEFKWIILSLIDEDHLSS